MSGIWQQKYCVIDVETTGANSVKNRLIEIACVQTQAGQILSKYSTLINPHQFIPIFIQKMTGIRNESVFKAPEPKEVLPVVKEIMLDGSNIFVAHNASFDYAFVKASFQRIGTNMPEIPKLCTLKLARRLLPPNIKKNVGSLSQYFNIDVRGRHRALGDAEATAKILVELLEIAESNHGITTTEELIRFHNKPSRTYKTGTTVLKRLNPFLEMLPNAAGVYYFKDSRGDILYVGKAKSLKHRVKSYFSQESMRSKKIADMLKKSYEITWTETDTELGALLLESKEIKRLLPPYNVMDKRYQNLPFIKIDTSDPYPKLEITDTIDNDNSEYYGPFRSAFLAKTVISIVDKTFRLRKCEKMPKGKAARSCLFFHIDKCVSPCTNGNQADYVGELEKVRSFLSGNADGILARLEAEMKNYSSMLEFEKALILKNNLLELQKLFQNKIDVPSSVKKNNAVFLLPASGREKTIEIFVIRHGTLFHQEIIGRMAPLTGIKHIIHNAFYNGLPENTPFTKESVNEMKIISSWLFKHSAEFKYVFIESKSESEAFNELQEQVRKFSFAARSSEREFVF